MSRKNFFTLDFLLTETWQVTKLKEENKRLHREVQDGANEATKKIQAKDKRMLQLEKKVCDVKPSILQHKTIQEIGHVLIYYIGSIHAG